MFSPKPEVCPNVADPRQQAYDRWKRQQGELFNPAEYEFPECPNCGEHAQPVHGISSDPSTGYYAEEQGCMACLEGVATGRHYSTAAEYALDHDFSDEECYE